MSPKSAQRFWDNDMHKNKGLKSGRVLQMTRFRRRSAVLPPRGGLIRSSRRQMFADSTAQR
ncbi:MAG: hypothetical protein E5X53_06340 [Mesorhizobium sp.]|nr:MAG: hypothetical protein EOR73_12040 [Mesorhizobium sp.]TIP73709.1 MAG: hypothetical protein E5X55_12350 [Mesorhizobium sp.]TIQ12254.1 MAG: hypothetical protein E5X57_14370 [Mesorhizobium sp.]TIR53197.1 MAG: hypothetical protein E5X53_06340 [Mesorhizobium sp.]TJV99390.1 MAG: hypothetical protein E5X52_06055 [Mesorhizobium sp.]